MTLKNGLEELIKAMLNSLPDDSLMLNAEVTSIKENNGNYLIDFKNKSSMLASSVVLATPAYISANVLAQLDDKVGKALSTIKYSSAIVVNLFYNIADLDDKLQGFGYVVPQSEGKFVQACSFSSVKFPDKLNNEYHLLRAFICGSQAKESLGLSHNEIIDKAVSEINDILKIKKKPINSNVIKYPNSMPQLEVGHGQKISEIEKMLAQHKKIKLIGSAYKGVGMPDCVSNASKIANDLAKELGATQTLVI